MRTFVLSIVGCSGAIVSATVLAYVNVKNLLNVDRGSTLDDDLSSIVAVEGRRARTLNGNALDAT